MRKLLPALIALLAVTNSSNAQSLPLSGGAMSGPVIGPGFVQTGSYRDFAPSGTITSDGNNSFNGGAIGRTFNSITGLTAGQHLTVDLGNAILVSYVSFGTHWASDPRFIPAAYSIDYSNDNSTWTNLVTVAGNTSLNPTHGSYVSARFWRLTAITAQSGYPNMQITGLRIIGAGYGAAAENYWNSAYGSDGIFTMAPVSIGTVDDLPTGYLLGVNGGVLATKVFIATLPNWPDYVFKKNYKLKPLSEIKTYIDMNHRLPDMPSERDVAEKGIDLGEMNKLLTKKVEELTLYLIEKDKQVQKEQQNNQSQQSQINELRKLLKQLVKNK